VFKAICLEVKNNPIYFFLMASRKDQDLQNAIVKKLTLMYVPIYTSDVDLGLFKRNYNYLNMKHP